MVTLTWLRGLLAHRRTRIISTALGVAVGVALLASIGAFLSASTSKMTARASAGVAVDWQVQAAKGADAAKLLSQVRHFGGVTTATPVRIADTTGLQATSAGTTQQTGPGRVVGLPAGYATAFPGTLRTLSGSPSGALLAQQTAANLHAKPGDTITIGRSGLPGARVRVSGVVEMPQADSFFQQVGAPAGAQPQAPPDNVILLPQSTFQTIEAPLARARPDLVVTQVHAALSPALPGSPSAAFTQVSGHARNLETALAGSGLVGDNLGTALDQARQDALYAQLLYLFLGVPGAILAGLVTASIASAGAGRRRRDAALLRTRGASTRRLVTIALGETALAGGAGVALGLGAALAIGSTTFGTTSFGASTLAAAMWAGGAALGGLVIAAASIALPAWRDARSLTVAGQRATVGRRDRAPWWARYGVDVIALAGSGLVYWQASKNGYSLVLAPEGVPQISVNWYALAAPVLGWIGAGLLAYRLADLVLVRGRTPLAALLRPIGGQLAPTVAATMGRQRRMLAGAVTLVALTAAFAASTAVFNATYQQQAEADARLTNGADVSVVESPGTVVGPQGAAALAKVRGVRSIEPLQHRFAYVGADLQDLYGVRPKTILAAGKLQNGWFAGGSAKQLMDTLAQRPDNLLLSQETVKDFQLQPGATVRLRLQDGVTKQLKTVPFHYVGVAKEFPTAPRDSFLVANQAYVAAATGSDAVGTFLVQTDGTNPATVANRIRRQVGTSAAVTDITTQRRIIGSNLTAVELSGLTRVELGFALILAICASGLALGLGFSERRRSFAIASALGARSRQLGAFVWGESAFVTLGGLLLGTLIAIAITNMLVKVLTGVFDPPPDYLSIPWSYLGGVLALTLTAVVAAGLLTLRSLRRPAIEELRDL
ncbi:MAG: putative transport system permease protein [Solirubrobacteraceae bacterium]|jgi:putative ABC transport system permease protein|nr:putative transport system permease protein [Solirubrobacteraceae bacterium]